MKEAINNSIKNNKDTNWRNMVCKKHTFDEKNISRKISTRKPRHNQR